MVRVSDELDFKYFPLSSLSGGQFRRMSLALLLATREMSSFRIASNLLVLDEPFQHLDHAGVLGTINALKNTEWNNGKQSGSVLIPMQNSIGLSVSEHFDNVTIVEYRGVEKGSFIVK